MAAKQARVVAELGRPETPAETAARKAESSRLHRVRQTPVNLVWSLLASVAVVIVIVLLVPRSDQPLDRSVDWHSVAADTQQGVPQTLADPALPRGWSANTAAYRSGGADRVDSWSLGFLTPSDEFIAVEQAFDANDVWVSKTLDNTLPQGSVTIDGVQWTVYDNRTSSDDTGNARYALVTQTPVSTWVVHGTAEPDEFEVLAKALTPTIQKESDGE